MPRGPRLPEPPSVRDRLIEVAIVAVFGVAFAIGCVAAVWVVRKVIGFLGVGA